jgi:hypothetical protein
VARQQALRTAGEIIPAPVLANLLIDTGASCTNIDHKFVAALGLASTGSVPVHTPSTGATPVLQPSYDIGMVIGGAPSAGAGAVHFVPNLPVLATEFSAQNLDGLLGRDILRLCRMTYSGPDNIVMLSF